MASDVIVEAGETRPAPLATWEQAAAARYVRRHAPDPDPILTMLALKETP